MPQSGSRTPSGLRRAHSSDINRISGQGVREGSFETTYQRGRGTFTLLGRPALPERYDRNLTLTTWSGFEIGETPCNPDFELKNSLT